MDMFRIDGGAALRGTVQASGSKNASLPIMAASILADGPVRLQRVPRSGDVSTLRQVLRQLGVESTRLDDRSLILETVDPSKIQAGYQLVRRMRASFCVLGPLLARRGKAVVSLPGGCNIGPRPVDLHLRGLALLGADVCLRRGYVIAHASRLRGAEVCMLGPHGPSVTGTANVMSAATLAHGRTIIRGAAREPEIVDLGRFLLAMGARIQGLGTSTLEIDGGESLLGVSYRVIADRIEAATLLIAAAITRGSVCVTDVDVGHLSGVLDVLSTTGANVEIGQNHVRLTSRGHILPTVITTRPYPGVPTDTQAQLMALVSLASGRSTIRDEVFPRREMHIAELNRLGARIESHGDGWVVQGVQRLGGATVAASDLRAGAALVLAGLAAKGRTVVRRIQHLDRGYEDFPDKLTRCGASLQRVPAPRRTQHSRLTRHVAAPHGL